MSSHLTRRRVLQGGVAAASVMLWKQPATAGAPPVEQVHLQFGRDAARSMTVSWSSATDVRRPRVRVGPVAHELGAPVAARTTHYVDGQSGLGSLSHHATLTHLAPDTTYVYEISHDGADPFHSTFRTAPHGRHPLRFTSFGDQTTGDLRDPIATPYATTVVDHIEAQDPLFNLVNGDLCYANFSGYVPGTNPFSPRPDIWRRWFANNQRSTARRPWMPAAGNHENESGNGPVGYASFASRFWLPDNGSHDWRNHWYTFTAGSVQVVVLQNDDVCYQDAGNTYVRGYSHGAQRRWLEQVLAAARHDRGVDWLVVCMHQLALSSSQSGNGSDLGIREEFVPLFDRYGVDLVLCGHDHDYERSYAVHGTVRGSDTRQPAVVTHDTEVVDVDHGAVHLTLGGGGTAVPTNVFTGKDPTRRTATVVTGRKSSTHEPADWSAVRDEAWPYGFATFDVDPGHRPGGTTTMRVTYYRTAAAPGMPPMPFDAFTLRRTRRDAPQHPRHAPHHAPRHPSRSSSSR